MVAGVCAKLINPEWFNLIKLTTTRFTKKCGGQDDVGVQWVQPLPVATAKPVALCFQHHYKKMNIMIKKIVTTLVLVGILLLGIVVMFLYENDKVDVKKSETKSGEVVNYFTETVEDGNTVLTYPLDTTHGLQPNEVIIGEGASLEEDGVFVKMSSQSFGSNDPTLAIVEGSDFHNGIIEVEMNGSVSQKASLIKKIFARGFIGISFRTKEDISTFESLYLRPTNGPTDDQTRKNHAVQYVSYPDWEFSRFREEAPEQYEAAAPIAPGEWQKVRVEVEDEVAKLYVNDGIDPVLVVNDLKLGPNASGKIGLWVGQGTNGFFRNLKITKFD
ncbi:DUF1080 domain-containing protein [Anaerolineales bacterium HSG25]|nr:DUF1080 domain-containing protein [Anaerolineales bacterium HSG25]